MKITLFILAIFVGCLAIIFDLQDTHVEISVGFFILPSAMFLAAALWKAEPIGDDRFRSMQKVFSVLAEEPIAMDILIKRLVGDERNDAISEYYESVIGRMLARRQLIIINGLVAIGYGTEDLS